MQVRHVLQDALQGVRFGDSIPSKLSAFRLYFKRAETDKVVLQLSCGCQKCAVRTSVFPKNDRCMDAAPDNVHRIAAVKGLAERSVVEVQIMI
jgi:hypothetical protein